MPEENAEKRTEVLMTLSSLLLEDNPEVSKEEDILGNLCYSSPTKTVWRGSNTQETTRKVCVKTFPRAQRENGIKVTAHHKVPLEAFILRNLQHPNIPRFVDYLEKGGVGFLLTEERSVGAGGKQLQKYSSLQQLEKVFSSKEIDHILRQLLCALRHARNKNIFHGNISSENILFNHENHILLTSWECSFFFTEPPERRKVFSGKSQYAPPEIALSKTYCPLKAEIWSLGLFLNSLLLNKKGSGKTHLNQEDLRKDFFFTALLQKMLQPNPTKRITHKQLYNYFGLSWL